MSSSFFVTGTDTEIGKTYVSTLLFKYFIAKGEKPVIMKPVASAEEEPSEDVREICKTMESCGYEITEELLRDIAPVTYPRPLAPYAVKEFVCNDLRKKLLDSYENLRKKFTIIIVEGIGGALVPIEKDFYAIDIANLFHIPVIVVAEDKLGVINHTLLTFEALAARELTSLGFILNRSKEGESSEIRSNREVIEELSGSPCIGQVVNGELSNCRI